MNPFAAAGIPLELGGVGLNAIGQRQGLNAMRDVWSNAGQQQAGYNSQINDLQNSFLNQLTPQTLTGADVANKSLGTSVTNIGNTLKAAKNVGNRKGGNVEGKAVAGQAMQGVQSNLMDQAKLQALMQGLQSGQFNTNMLGHQLNQDTGIVRSNARDAASLVPLFENAASQKGSAFRQLGTLGQMAGQGMLNYGMSQPGHPSSAPFGPQQNIPGQSLNYLSAYGQP